MKKPVKTLDCNTKLRDEMVEALLTVISHYEDHRKVSNSDITSACLLMTRRVFAVAVKNSKTKEGRVHNKRILAQSLAKAAMELCPEAVH
jgi:hypothetical protein